MERTDQAAVVELAFDEVVLRSVAQGGQRRLLVVEPGQHHNRGHPGGGARGADRVQPAAVRQRQVEQHKVEPGRGQLPQRVTQSFGTPDLERAAPGFGQVPFEQPGVAGVILNQQNPHVVDVHHASASLRRMKTRRVLRIVVLNSLPIAGSAAESSAPRPAAPGLSSGLVEYCWDE